MFTAKTLRVFLKPSGSHLNYAGLYQDWVIEQEVIWKDTAVYPKFIPNPDLGNQAKNLGKGWEISIFRL